MRLAMTSPRNESVRIQPSIRPQAVSVRFQTAFPELTELFDWLNGAMYAGARWPATLKTYLAKIEPNRTATLTDEVLDVGSMGLSKERDVGVLVCAVLGLDEKLLEEEHITASRFLDQLKSTLLALVAA